PRARVRGPRLRRPEGRRRGCRGRRVRARARARARAARGSGGARPRAGGERRARERDRRGDPRARLRPARPPAAATVTILHLTAPGLALTELRESDIDVITAYCQDPVFERFLTTPWPYERAHAEFFVREYAAGGWQRGDEATWAIRETPDGELLGAIGVRRPSGSVGYWLGAPHRGRGLMTAALETVADAAFAPDGLALDRLTWE